MPSRSLAVGYQNVEQQERIPHSLVDELQHDPVRQHDAAEIDGEPPLRREVEITGRDLRLPVRGQVAVEHVDDILAVGDTLDGVQQGYLPRVLARQLLGRVPAQVIDDVENGVGLPAPALGDEVSPEGLISRVPSANSQFCQ